jgi:hypothetical protein
MPTSAGNTVTSSVEIEGGAGETEWKVRGGREGGREGGRKEGGLVKLLNGIPSQKGAYV